MTKDEALKMAIYALNRIRFPVGDGRNEALQACKEALEQPSVAELNDEYLRDTRVEGLSQPAQEPVAYCKHGVPKGVCRLGERDCNPAPSWQGLSDEEIIEKCAPIWGAIINTRDREETVDFARAIEKALKEKNNE